MEKKEPLWCTDLRRDLLHMAEELTVGMHGWEEKEITAAPEQFGYRNGMATAYIQKAINYVTERGGGKVRLEKGDYLSGTIELKSNVWRYRKGHVCWEVHI